jgi:phage N-6-adenine-methyltransferase
MDTPMIERAGMALIDTETGEIITQDACEINREHKLARHSAENFVQHSIRCGELLTAKKAELRHGEFKPWIAANCEFSYQSAARYMQVAEKKSLTRETFESLREALGQSSATLALKHTGDEESYTPAEYLESARAVMGGFDLDPASNPMAQESVRAGEYLTVDDDGLSRHWSGRVWLNPPYTALVINKFVDKLVSHYLDGDVTEAIMLTNNNTDTSWFHQAAKTASAVCFTAGRINFLKRDGSTSSPTNGQAFLYFGEDVERFHAEFSQHGMVMVKA